MNDVKKFDMNTLLATLERGSEILRKQIPAFLIGGLAMGAYGLKESTKDTTRHTIPGRYTLSTGSTSPYRLRQYSTEA